MTQATMTARQRPRLGFGATCRGGGKIYVVLKGTDLEGATLRATARVRGNVEVPARIVQTDDGRQVLVLCVLAATQVVVVEARNEQGACVARATTNVGRHLARLSSMANTLMRNPDVDVVRNCDERPLPGDMELVSCRTVWGGDAGDLLHVVFSYPVETGKKDGTIDVRAFEVDGTPVDLAQADDSSRGYAGGRLRVLGSCVAPHLRIPEVPCRYVCVSVPTARLAALWVRSGDAEGLWRLPCDMGPLPSVWARSMWAQDAMPPAVSPRVNVVAIEGTDCVLVSSAACAVDEDAVAMLTEVAMREGVGIASGRCVFADGTVARGELVVEHLNWHVAHYGELAVDEQPHEVVAACGELLVLRRSVWETVGGVDEGASERSWFADLCLRIRALGLAVVEVPRAQLRVDATARYMGVPSWDELMQDVCADAWLKQRWPEVLGVPERTGGAAGESGPVSAPVPEQGMRLAVSKVVRDRDEDIVRGDLEVVGQEGDVSGELALTVLDAQENPATSAWVCMGDRTEALGSDLARRVVGFSVRVSTEASEFLLRATLAGPTTQEHDLLVGRAELAGMRDAWQRATVVPDRDPAYDEWVRTRHRACRADLALQHELATGAEDPLVFSVVVDSQDAPDEEVARTLESVCAQTYAHYELLSDADANPQGDFVLRLEPGDVLEPDALFWMAREARIHPNAELVYADEDSLIDGRYCLPVLKPDFDAVRLRHQDYLGRMVATRADVTQAAVGCHVPRVLLHTAIPCKLGWCTPPEPTWEGSRPLVSVIIPNKDAAPVLERCVRSVLERTAWDNLEVVVVENNSEQEQTFALYERLQVDPRVRVITCELEHGFNFSKLCNEGVAQARGSYVLMLNNDTEVLQADWLDRLMETCARDEVGCVGAKLLYPDDTVQHVGVFVGSHLGPWHANMDVPAADEGYLGVNVVPHRMRAVTGACLLARRAVWDLVGGMDEELPVDYNDVDLCLRIGERGYAVVVRPDVTLRHYESVSRGRGRSEQAAIGFAHAEGVLRARWGHLVFAEDPNFNPSFRHNCGRLVLNA